MLNVEQIQYLLNMLIFGCINLQTLYINLEVKIRQAIYYKTFIFYFYIIRSTNNSGLIYVKSFDLLLSAIYFTVMRMI